ncbi:hypothetical protein [Lacticaseibacillus rhamnosus]|nr:hypothetical protein [Lacticaseibacillus rhamnosus]
MMTAILKILLTPTAPIWSYLIVAIAGVFVGATIVGGWKQWLE